MRSKADELFACIALRALYFPHLRLAIILPRKYHGDVSSFSPANRSRGRFIDAGSRIRDRLLIKQLCTQGIIRKYLLRASRACVYTRKGKSSAYSCRNSSVYTFAFERCVLTQSVFMRQGLVDRPL